jgi:hypothetical protein
MAVSQQRAATIEGGFPQPEPHSVARPQRVEATLPNPRHTEAPPVGPYKIEPYHGPYSLTALASDPDVRSVTESDLSEIPRYLPRYLARHPRATPEGMLPLLKLATQGGIYRFLRTDNAFALFVFARMPEEPLGEVLDYFIVGRENADPKKVGWEMIKLCRAGLEWAISLGAAKFSLGEDNGHDLSPIAKRLKLDVVSMRYSILL